MTVKWGTWSAFEHSPGQPLHEVSRAVARRYFDDLMQAMPQRLQLLQELLDRNGVALTRDDDGLGRLNKWFIEHVEPDPSNPQAPAARWFAVGLDIGLFIGDTILERAPGLRWELFTGGGRNVSFQRPVIMGFTGVPNPKYNVDPDRLVGVHAHRVIAGDQEPASLFADIVRASVSRA